jgi:hypothetical protein
MGASVSVFCSARQKTEKGGGFDWESVSTVVPPSARDVSDLMTDQIPSRHCVTVSHFEHALSHSHNQARRERSTGASSRQSARRNGISRPFYLHTCFGLIY